MDLHVFYILIYIFNLNVSGSNECAYRSDFLKYYFYYFYGYANFCICTLHFQYPSAFENLLHHASQLK
jgi:hypothetical protein